MRTFLLLALTLTLAVASVDTITTTCPKKEVFINHICVEVNYIQGCKIYASKDKCQVCHTGYTLNRQASFCNQISRLSSELKVKIGCLQIDDSGICINCANGFYEAYGTCDIGIKNCATYSSNGDCLNCEKDHSLIMGQCRHNQLLGCQSQSQNHVCLRCMKPFELVNGNCVIDNCKSYYDYGCVDCQCGYYLGKDKKCIPMEMGCIKYSRSVCVGCAKNFRLKGGVCRIEGCISQEIDPTTGPFCSKCHPGFKIVGSICQIENCLQLLNQSCLICKDGFHLKDGNCVSSSQHFACQD